MQPTPNEIARGVARILRETVAPAVTDAHAAGQLGQVITVLGQVDWDEATFALARTERRLAELLAEIPELVNFERAHAARSSQVGWEVGREGSFGELGAAVRAHREKLEELLVALRARRDVDGPESTQVLLDRIGAVLSERG